MIAVVLTNGLMVSVCYAYIIKSARHIMATHSCLNVETGIPVVHEIVTIFSEEDMVITR